MFRLAVQRGQAAHEASFLSHHVSKPFPRVSDSLPSFCAGVLLRRRGALLDDLFRPAFLPPQIRVLKKCPELVEDFIERVVVLLVERSHGVVLCGVQVCARAGFVWEETRWGGGGWGGSIGAS